MNEGVSNITGSQTIKGFVYKKKDVKCNLNGARRHKVIVVLYAFGANGVTVYI